jgi:hypothetical protein
MRPHALLMSTSNLVSILLPTVNSRTHDTEQESVPVELSRSLFDRLEVRQVQMEKPGLARGLPFQRSDGPRRLLLVPGGDVHLGILRQQCLKHITPA